MSVTSEESTMYQASADEALGGLDAGPSVSVTFEESTIYCWESTSEALGGLDTGLSVSSVLRNLQHTAGHP